MKIKQNILQNINGLIPGKIRKMLQKFKIDLYNLNTKNVLIPE